MIINKENITTHMAKEVVPVRERLERLQKTNYRSLPLNVPEKTVDDEIEEFRKSSLIKPVLIREEPEIREATAFVSKEEERKVQEAAKIEDTIIKDIELKVGKIETIKADMMREGKFVVNFYEIKKIEKEMLPLLYDAKALGMEIPEKLKARIAVAAPNASLVE